MYNLDLLHKRLNDNPGSTDLYGVLLKQVDKGEKLLLEQRDVSQTKV